MKKVCFFFALALFLTGCGAQEAMETIADEFLIPSVVEPREISVELPGETMVSTIQNDAGRIYICDGYEIILETMDSGDLDATLRTVTGFGREDLTLMKTEEENVKRYDFCWASAGESGEQAGQGVILDDGNYHYVLSVLRDAEPETPSQIIWSRVFQSFRLV